MTGDRLKRGEKKGGKHLETSVKNSKLILFCIMFFHNAKSSSLTVAQKTMQMFPQCINAVLSVVPATVLL